MKRFTYLLMAFSLLVLSANSEGPVDVPDMRDDVQSSNLIEVPCDSVRVPDDVATNASSTGDAFPIWAIVGIVIDLADLDCRNCI